MENKIRVRVPQVVDIETAIEIYYSHYNLRNKEIARLFGNIGRARICRLKDMARELMHEKEVIAYDPTSVDTVTAFEAWGLNIADLEKRHKKLCELERRRNNA